MGDPPRTPRRTPGGALPPHLVRPRRPGSNGHAARPAPRLMPQGWSELDEQDDARLAAERTAFRRVAEIEPDVEVHRSVRPSRAVIIGVLVIAAVIVLAVVAYRMAPP